MERYNSIQHAQELAIRVSVLAREQGKLSAFIIGNTKKQLEDNRELYYPCIKELSRVVAAHAVVYSQKCAAAVAGYVDGLVDIIFVDAEKKALKSPGEDLGNIASAVVSTAKKSKVYTFKANDLSVDSVDAFLACMMEPLAGKRVTIIGAGNLGFKVALKLVERGVNVTITRRNRELLAKIAEVINSIKPEETIACVNYSFSNLGACVDADAVIGMTTGVPVVTVDMVKVMKADGLLIDVGKGCIFPDAIDYARSKGVRMFRVDVRGGFEGTFSTILETERLLAESMGRKNVNGVWVVAGGLLGEKGDVVVDFIDNPKQVVGVANGQGDFLSALSRDDIEKMDAMKRVIIANDFAR